MDAAEADHVGARELVAMVLLALTQGLLCVVAPNQFVRAFRH